MWIATILCRPGELLPRESFEILDKDKNTGERVRVDQNSRAQIRLILEDATSRTMKAVDDRLNGIYAEHAAKGRLRSGATVTLGLTAIEETAGRFITSCVDQVATIAKDIEAFGMINEAVEGLLRFLAGHVDRVATKATGASYRNDDFHRIFEAAKRQFADSQLQLRRQLEIHRFAFTVPQPLPSIVPSPTLREAKSRGGKPVAAHWDEMWAAIAILLYTGDLQPKTQADIERAMKDWLAASNLDGGDTAVRDRARHLWRKLQEAE